MRRNIVWGTALTLLLLLCAWPAAADQLPAEICTDLKAERLKLPASVKDVCEAAGDERCPLGAMLNAVALRHPGWGLSQKTSGYFVVSPAGRVASDILERKADQLMFDVLSDGSVTAAPACGDDIGKGSRPFVDPVGNAPAPAPAPAPGPAPAAEDLSPRVAAVEASVAQLREYAGQLQAAIAALAENLAAQRDALNNHEQRLQALEARPIPASCRASILGYGISCRLE